MIGRLLLAVGAAVLAGLVALPGAIWPLLPAQSLAVDVGSLRAVFGSLAPADERGVRVSSASSDSALQAMPGLDIDAGVLNVLRYRMRDFPETLELVFMWRVADDPQDLRSATIPAPGKGDHAFALDQLPDWKGRVIEVGFGQIPTAQHVPAGADFAPFTIEALSLESAALSNALRGQVDAMTGLYPWAQRSINSLGRELSENGGSSFLVPVVVALAVFVLVVVVLFRRRACVPIAVSVIACWIVLDLCWQGRLNAQVTLTGKATALAPFADTDLSAVAERVAQVRAGVDPDAKVMVAAPSLFMTHRLIWHLAPVDAADWAMVRWQPEKMPDGTLILVHRDEAANVVSNDGSTSALTSRRVRGLEDLGDWQVIQFLGNGAAP